jgi:hypothetical protein
MLEEVGTAAHKPEAEHFLYCYMNEWQKMGS